MSSFLKARIAAGTSLHRSVLVMTAAVLALGVVVVAAKDAQAIPVRSATVPNAPTSVMAVRGDAQLVVSWGPSYDGARPITGYTVTSRPEGKTCTTTGETTCTVTGLTNGTPYRFVVTATNIIGTSQASAASAAIRPGTVPNAPTSAAAVRGNHKATVSWGAPYDGGSPITGYTVTSSPEGKTCTTTGETTCVVTGLTNGTRYRFTVTATNAAGTSQASASSTSVKPG